MSSSSSPESPHPATPSNELRHMTSNSNVLVTPAKDSSKHSRFSPLQTNTMRLGSRSPSSIPSSPTSVHSSSSAIFERDIEPTSPSPPHSNHHSNPHRIPRAKATEQLDLSVPSVLDSAAEILTSPLSSVEDDALVAVVAPAPGRKSGLASPMSGRSRSRSPSPTSGRPSTMNRTSLLLGTGTIIPMSLNTKDGSPPGGSPPKETTLSPVRPTIQTAMGSSNTPSPLLVSGALDPQSSATPTSVYFSTTSSAASSPTTTTMEHPPQPLPSAAPSSPSRLPSRPLSISHPPSPNAPSKRLSFMSYSDLLASTPASLHPLSSLTTSASLTEPPPHIPSVSGLTQNVTNTGSAGSIHGFGGGRDRDSIAMLDDIGGEWEREGLGRGLEERLEALMVKV